MVRIHLKRIAAMRGDQKKGHNEKIKKAEGRLLRKRERERESWPEV